MRLRRLRRPVSESVSASVSVRARMRWLSRKTIAMHVITSTRQAAVSSMATTLMWAK